MTQPEFGGTDKGRAVMIFGSDGSKWIAALIDALGHFQLDIVDAAGLQGALGSEDTDVFLVEADVKAAPSAVLTHGTALMGTNAAVIKAANANRLGIAISNRGTVTIYIGKDNTVTTGNGFPMMSGQGLSFEGYVGSLWGISTIGGQGVRWLEV